MQCFLNFTDNITVAIPVCLHILHNGLIIKVFFFYYISITSNLCCLIMMCKVSFANWLKYLKYRWMCCLTTTAKATASHSDTDHVPLFLPLQKPWAFESMKSSSGGQNGPAVSDVSAWKRAGCLLLLHWVLLSLSLYQYQLVKRCLTSHIREKNDSSSVTRKL